jgi:O-antigen/teichoic acid export membrane protein
MTAEAGLWQARWKRGTQWGRRLAEFGFVQGLVQLLTAVAGLLIVRTLTKHEYALFAIANSMQTACNLLADLGIGIGVRSIGGRVWNDPQRFGQLLNTVLGLRRQFAVVSLSICLPVAAWMLWRNGATIPVVIGLCLVTAASVIPLLGVTAWGTSAQFHGEYRRIQKLDFGNALLRLALIAGLALVWINALLATLVGVVGNWVQMIFLRRWALAKIVPSAAANLGDRRELLVLAKKSLPNTIFFCFQGQVTLLILTWIGNPTGVADVTALGRIAVLFTIFSATFNNLLAPRFARCQGPSRLPRLYLLLVIGTLLVLAPLVLLSWLFPAPLLWLLGSKYASLEAECGWVIATGCIAQIGGVMWSLNCARAWLFIQPSAFIPTILASQIVCAMALDLRQFHDVLVFNLVGTAAPLWIYLVDALIGMRRAKREMASAPSNLI